MDEQHIRQDLVKQVIEKGRNVVSNPLHTAQVENWVKTHCKEFNGREQYMIIVGIQGKHSLAEEDRKKTSEDISKMVEAYSKRDKEDAQKLTKAEKEDKLAGEIDNIKSSSKKKTKRIAPVA